MKRAFDICFSAVALILLFPLLLLLSLLLVLEDGFPVVFKQPRIGRGGRVFTLYKFRTMYNRKQDDLLLTVGSKDSRITRHGRWIRKYKLDELPQLFNVLNGSMSLVGPRPEVKKYVDLYTENQRRVLLVKPGITDYASLKYFSEADLLAASHDPEATYIREIMPAKLEINLSYIDKRSMLADLKILVKTCLKILSV